MFDVGDPAALTITISDTTPVSASISPANAEFNKNPGDTIEHKDVTTTITWNSASSLLGINIDGAYLHVENWYVDGDTLTIKKDYLANIPVGNHYLTIVFDHTKSQR